MSDPGLRRRQNITTTELSQAPSVLKF